MPNGHVLTRTTDERTQLEAVQQRLNCLAQAAQTFAEVPLDVPVVLETIAWQIGALVGDGCAVRLLAGAGHRLAEGASYHPDRAAQAALQALLIDTPHRSDEGLIGQVVRTTEPVLLPARPAPGMPAVAREPWLDELRARLGSALFVPLRSRGGVIGLLVATRGHESAYTLDDLSLVQDLADRAAQQLENARLHHAVQEELAQRRRAEATLRASEARFRLLAENAEDLIFRYRLLPTRGFDYVSPSATAISGYTPEEHYADPDLLFKIIHPDDRAQLQRQLTPQHRGTAPLGAPRDSGLLRWCRKDGRVIWGDQRITLIRDQAGRIVAVEGIVRDVSARVTAEAALRTSEAILAEAERIAHLGSWEHDILQDRLRWSDECFRIAGRTPQGFAVTPQSVSVLLHPEDRERVALAYQAALDGGPPYDLDYRIVRPDGVERIVHQQAEVIRDQLGRPIKALGITQDVTEQREMEAQLRRQATHDALTGLPNRTLFLSRLGDALARAHQGGPTGAVLFLDLDRFKDVNDSLGHAAGDRLLVAVAARLRAGLREQDLLARLGGDEFTVLLERVTDPAEAARLADQLAHTLDAPIAFDGHEHLMTASVGVVLASVAYARAEDVLRDADVAMYRAKAAGKARYAVFDPPMQAAVLARLALERDLRLALERGQFGLHYQPIVDLRSGRIVKVEALARWQHPGRGLVPPGDFIPLAEESGLIVPLGRWVLGEACRQARSWVEAGTPLAVAVNLTAREFQHPALAEEVAAALGNAGLDPAWLRLEITESLAMRDAAATVATLGALRALGVETMIDDFGTGYSSLAYLQRLPVDTLKIDKAFVDGLGEEDEGDQAIVAAIITLAHALGLRVIAEGVETAAQALRLRALGCDQSQGYHFARPQPAAELMTLLERGAVLGALPIALVPRRAPNTGALQQRREQRSHRLLLPVRRAPDAE